MNSKLMESLTKMMTSYHKYHINSGDHDDRYCTKSESEILQLLALAETKGWKEATVSSTKLSYGASSSEYYKYTAVIPVADCAANEYYFLKTNNGSIYYGTMIASSGCMCYPKLLIGSDVSLVSANGVSDTVGQRTFNLDGQQALGYNAGWSSTNAGGTGIVASLNKDVKAWYIRVSDVLISDLKVNKSNVLSTLSQCLASTNSQDVASANAVSEVNNKLAWKLKGTVTGTASISTNFDFNEIKIVSVTTTGAVYTVIISKEEITAANNNNRWYYGGYYDNSSGYGGAAWLVTSSVASLRFIHITGTAYESTATTYLYYR